jgi:hypothetical protein
MSLYRLEFPSAIRHVAFSRHDAGNHLLVLTNRGVICGFFRNPADAEGIHQERYTFGQVISRDLEPSFLPFLVNPSQPVDFFPFIIYTFSLPEDIKYRARQILWVDEHLIVVLACSSEDSLDVDCLSVFQVISEKAISQLWRISLDSKLIRMLVDEITGRLLLEDISGRLFEGTFPSLSSHSPAKPPL